MIFKKRKKYIFVIKKHHEAWKKTPAKRAQREKMNNFFKEKNWQPRKSSNNHNRPKCRVSKVWIIEYFCFCDASKSLNYERKKSSLESYSLLIIHVILVKGLFPLRQAKKILLFWTVCYKEGANILVSSWW